MWVQTEQQHKKGHIFILSETFVLHTLCSSALPQQAPLWSDLSLAVICQPDILQRPWVCGATSIWWSRAAACLLLWFSIIAAAEKVGGELVPSTVAVSVSSEKPFVVTWVVYCVCKKQKAFCVAFCKHWEGFIDHPCKQAWMGNTTASNC